jgi:glyoxylase-like metal-dependent hydrolase (beta-lactamase superfamily II)
MPAAAQANDTFYKSASLTLDNETLQFGLISQFHTDGDIYVHFPESNVLITGDMMTVGTYPLLDYVTGGWINGAQACTTGLLAIADADTLIVPADGPVQRRPALEIQQQMLDHAYQKVADAYRNGRSLDQFMAAAPMADYDDLYGDPALFVELLYRGTWYHVPGRAIQGII